MFSKILSINIVSTLVCIIVMGSAQMVMITDYFSRESEQYLGRNADAIVSVIKSGVTVDGLDSMVNNFSRVTGSYIYVIDDKGRILSGSDSDDLINKPPMFLEDEYTKAVLSGKKNTMIGTVGGLFEETMFTLQMPIVTASEEVVGAVSVSRPIPEHQRMRYDMFKILLSSMLIISVIAAALSYLLAKSFSGPMKNMREAIKEFAKGNFGARVNITAEKSAIAEIAELAGAFNKMAEKLEKSEEIKNAFVSDVSHELRTPMTTIGGFVSGMLDDTIPQERQKEYLKIVQDEVQRLSRLVDTFLDITRLQSDKMTLNMTNFDINELIRITVIGFEQKIEKRNINVELSLDAESCFVFADRDSITRVMTNLFDNAVKFTNENGLISISVEKRQKEVFVAIRNTGRGISAEQLPMIFNRFYKTDKSRSENREGNGIGLYLVKNILNAHGKDISANSVEGEYAEFVFRLNKGKSTQERR